MRIIAGKYKGRVLKSFKASHIRPTSDRVKESLFNILQGQVEGARVLDLYGGTGNLTIEALSRGAEHVTCVEKNSKSISIIQSNLRHLEIPKNEVTLVKKDVLRFLKAYEGPAFDIILIDPPFTEKLAHPTMEQLVYSQVLGQHTVTAIESSEQERLDPSYDWVKEEGVKKFGDKRLTLFVSEE